jgi:ABC-type transporter Mla subunit MlaD
VSIPYLATFTGAVGDLKAGAPIKLQGFTVGEVDSSELNTDARTGDMTTAVVLLLDPTQFHIRDFTASNADWTRLMNSTLAKLVERSLRVRLTQDPPLIGASQIELAMVPGAAPAPLTRLGAYLKIPTVEGGGLADLAGKLGQLPLRQIGENLRTITERVKELSSSPQLTDSIHHLDRALAELDKTMQRVGPQIGPTVDSVHQAVDSLRHAASEIDATSASARKLIGANPASPDGGLEHALHELEGAARAIRTLADYLDQHPEALIKGRAREEAIR